MSAKKMNRRDFLRGVVVAAGGTALAACAPKVVKETVEVERVVQETVIVEGTPEVVEKVVTATPPPMSTEPLRVGSWFGTMFDSTIAMYEEKFGRKVVHGHTPWAEYQTKIFTEMAAGVPPDVVLLEGTFGAQNYKTGVRVTEARSDVTNT